MGETVTLAGQKSSKLKASRLVKSPELQLYEESFLLVTWIQTVGSSKRHSFGEKTLNLRY